MRSSTVSLQEAEQQVGIAISDLQHIEDRKKIEISLDDEFKVMTPLERREVTFASSLF